MKITLTTLASTLFTALAIGCSSTDSSTSAPAPASDPAATTASALQGHWASEGCLAVSQPTGNIYLKLDFTFTGATWKHATEVYGDAACTARLLSAEVSGTFDIGSTSKVVTSA